MGGSSHVVDESVYEPNEGEEFRGHPVHLGYKLSNKSRIRLLKSNFSKRWPGRITKGCRLKRGGLSGKYEYVVHLKYGGNEYTRRMSRLVAESWFPQPTTKTSKLVVYHWDGDSENNSPENIQWMSLKQALQLYHNNKNN